MSRTTDTERGAWLAYRASFAVLNAPAQQDLFDKSERTQDEFLLWASILNASAWQLQDHAAYRAAVLHG